MDISNALIVSALRRDLCVTESITVSGGKTNEDVVSCVDAYQFHYVLYYSTNNTFCLEAIISFSSNSRIRCIVRIYI